MDNIIEDAPQWLKGKKGLVIGLANQKSIAWGCARVFHAMGADLALTYLNETTRKYTEDLARQLNAGMFLPCDVQKAGSLENVFEEIRNEWGRIDFLLHSIAFAPADDLHGRVTDCSLEGFGTAMDISCHSFIRMAKLAEPLMTNGGTMLTISYHGAEKVVQDYGIMGPTKAALEAVTKYLAAEMGKKQIRVHAISPGPIMTRAASGVKNFEKMISEAQAKAPLGLADIEDIGWAAGFLASDKARHMTGNITYIDGGLNILANG